MFARVNNLNSTESMTCKIVSTNSNSLSMCASEKVRPVLALLLGIMLLYPGWSMAEEYESRQAFLQRAFIEPSHLETASAPSKLPPVQTLWLKPQHKDMAQQILGHPYNGMRVRYWAQGKTSAWILHEIGKERPIRIGIIIDGEKIRDVRILAFEESRGWEVRYPFFTEQF